LGDDVKELEIHQVKFKPNRSE